AVDGDPAREAAFARLVQSALGERGRALGLEPRRGESDDQALLRPAVIGTLAELGADAKVIAAATALARRWLVDPASVPPPAAQLALPIAARGGDAALHEALVALVRAGPPPQERSLAMAALGSFRDPELLARSFDLFLGELARASDFWPLF